MSDSGIGIEVTHFVPNERSRVRFPYPACEIEGFVITFAENIGMSHRVFAVNAGQLERFIRLADESDVTLDTINREALFIEFASKPFYWFCLAVIESGGRIEPYPFSPAIHRHSH